jgi:hypothetical protein
MSVTSGFRKILGEIQRWIIELRKMGLPKSLSGNRCKKKTPHKEKWKRKERMLSTMLVFFEISRLSSTFREFSLIAGACGRYGPAFKAGLSNEASP